MTQNLIAAGTRIEELAQYEDLIPEGARGELVLYLSEPVSQEVLEQICGGIATSGIVLWDDIIETMGANPKITIRFEKHIAPLLLIGLVVGGLLLLPVVIFGFRLFLMPAQVVMRTVVLPVALMAVGTVIIISLAKRPKGA